MPETRSKREKKDQSKQPPTETVTADQDFDIEENDFDNRTYHYALTLTLVTIYFTYYDTVNHSTQTLMLTLVKTCITNNF